eukprot:TRINITY_DN4452_c1_g1_i1.p1 TRINITY_DN4452_c1_g1~~TRINITY_DN4452_c1_g1_i1.p1  ORF type:complete len:457 (+),score=87.12 TRINITY_DN4452_c1_g1_i1:45-1415(+)
MTLPSPSTEEVAMKRARILAISSAIHLVMLWNRPSRMKADIGISLNTLSGIIGLVWYFTRSTFGFPLLINIFYAAGLSWIIKVWIDGDNDGIPAAISCGTLIAGAVGWRNHTFDLTQSKFYKLPTQIPSKFMALFLGNRPSQPIANHGRTGPVSRTKPPKSIAVIINPEAGRGNARIVWEEAKAVLISRGIEIERILETQKSGDGTHLARDYDGPAECLVAVGGDGTLSEVLNGIMQRDKKLPLGCIPGGTCNNFCFDLGIRTPTDAASRIVTGCIAPIDAAQVHHNGKITYGLNALAWGVGLKAVQFADKLGFLGPLKFDVGGLLAILSFTPTTVTLKLTKGDKKWEVKQCCVIAMSMVCQRAGNGFRFGPMAKLDDGLMDTCLLRQISVLRTLELFDEVKREGSHLHGYDTEYHQWDSMHLETPTETPISLDGEDTGSTPATVKVLQKAFECFV